MHTNKSDNNLGLNNILPSFSVKCTEKTQYTRRKRQGNYLDRDSFNPVRGEIALWRAVITQALMDASSNSSKAEALHEKAEALSWLRGTSKDFIKVCYFAGWDPDYVRSRVMRALSRGCQWRAVAGSVLPRRRKTPSNPLPGGIDVHSLSCRSSEVEPA